MIIISDTTPLRYLIEIEAAHILEILYGKITIPEKVFSELRGVNTPPKVKAWIQARPIWVEVRKADTSLFTPIRNIHDGEREAIALAIELQADAFLSNDGNAIKEALRLNIPTIRLFTILESAAERKLIDLPDAIRKMQRTTFHSPPDTIIIAMLERDRLRKEAEEEARKKGRVPSAGWRIREIPDCASSPKTHLGLRSMRGAEMRAHIQSVAIWFLLVTGSFTLTQSGSLSIGAEPSKRQFVANAQYEPERLLERDVRHFIYTHPGASAEGITAYANSALQKHGYIYKFHSCDFIDSRKLEPLNSGHHPAIHSVYSLPFDLARGGRRMFKIHVEDVGPCSNCFALIPALSFSAQSVLAVLDGKKYLLKRPVEFRLEEIELVDETMKRVICKWEVPNETFPIGVSADGRTLYLPVEFTEGDHDASMRLQGGQGKKSYPSSVLAISPTGFRFEVAAKALVDQNIEETRYIPASPDSDGLSFMLVRVKGKTYVIRYPGVCT